MKNNPSLGAALIVFLAVCFTGIPLQATEPSYRISELNFFGSERSDGYSVSQSGKTTGVIYPGPMAPPMEAFLKDGPHLINLGKMLGSDVSVGVSVNDAGQVVGVFKVILDKFYTLHGFLYKDGAIIDLGALGPLRGWESMATGINRSGQVVGSTSTIAQGRPGFAFLYNNGEIVELSSLGATPDSVASAINDSGQIVGYSSTDLGQYHAVLWSNGGITDLGTLGGPSGVSYAWRINNAGEVVGTSTTLNGNGSHAFLWRKGTFTDLGTLGGNDSRGNSINASGQVVGSSLLSDGRYHAFLWSDGTMMDLNDLIPSNSGWVLGEATGINDAGLIIGTGIGPDGKMHGFLMEPVSLVPTTTAYPRGGVYGTTQSVTLTCSDPGGPGCDKIYYTTDGTIPTPSSSVYTAPISISATTTLKFFAMDLIGNSEAVKTETYTITDSITVTVKLKDSGGNPIKGGIVKYYSDGWKSFGTTDANGRASKELPPGSYNFSMTYAYGRQEKTQNIGMDSTVLFQTIRVTVQWKDSTGAPLDTGTVQYYSGGWRTFGATSGGQVAKELLPASYKFRITYAYARQEKSQDIATDATVIFRTGRVHSDSGHCTQYYAGGWRSFIQDMELLPMKYSFRFNDGTSNSSSTVIAGTVNHIH